VELLAVGKERVDGTGDAVAVVAAARPVLHFLGTQTSFNACVVSRVHDLSQGSVPLLRRLGQEADRVRLRAVPLMGGRQFAVGVIEPVAVPVQEAVPPELSVVLLVVGEVLAVGVERAQHLTFGGCVNVIDMLKLVIVHLTNVSRPELVTA